MVAAQAAGRLGAGSLPGETTFDVFKVVLPLGGFPLGGIDAAMGRGVVQPRCGNVHLHRDIVVEAQMLVDIGGGHLAGRDGADGAGRAGDAVSSGEHIIHIAHLAGAGGHKGAPLDGHAGLLEPGDLDALTDGHHDDVRFHAHFRQSGLLRAGTAGLVGLAGDLGLHPQGNGFVVLVGFDADRRHQRQHFRALRHSAGDLVRQGGHILDAAAVDAGHLLRTQADGAAGHVHGHVAAADDHHVLAGEVRHVTVADAPQHLHGGHDVFAVLAGDTRALTLMGADGDVQAVVLLLELLEGDLLAHGHVGVGLDTQREDGVDLRVQLLPREAVAGDAVAQHAAQL